MRRGVRAGSRWPMTMETHFAPGDFRFGGYIPFPIFLSSAAGWLESVAKGDGVSGIGMRPDIEVHIHDSIARGESYADCGAFLNDLQPDWIVCETATSAWQHDKRILRHITQLLPQVKIVLCGTISAGGHLDEITEMPGVVAVVKGEYEKGIARVILGGDVGLIPHDFLSVSEMNGPNGRFKWDEGAAKNYFDSNPRGQRPVQLQMWASRGCVYKCNFCSWPASMTNDDPDGMGRRTMRYYSPEWIEAYILERAKVMGPLGSVYFDGDTENISDGQTQGICKVMAKLGVPWAMMCRADTSSRETWESMKKSGCFGVKIGFESGSQRVVNNIVGKKLNLAEAAETAKFLRKIGMTVHGTFMVGLPGETPDEAQMTYKFIEDLYAAGGLDTHQLSGTAEIDGTPLANMKPGVVQPKYPEAVKDENYKMSYDGQKKAEEMTRAIQVVK